MKRVLTYLLAILVVVVGIWWLMSRPANAPSETSPTPTELISSSVSESPQATSNNQPAITITSPKANALLEGAITITGKARVFENQITVAITDLDNKIIIDKQVQTDAKEADQYGNYSVTLTPPATTPGDIKIVAYSLSPKGDGSYEARAETQVRLKTLSIQY